MKLCETTPSVASFSCVSSCFMCVNGQVRCCSICMEALPPKGTALDNHAVTWPEQKLGTCFRILGLRPLSSLSVVLKHLWQMALQESPT